MDATASQPTTTSKPRRHWFRFSLRTMMVAIALICVWLGVISYRANKQKQRGGGD